MTKRERSADGLQRYGELLHPGVLAEIDHWAAEPDLSELRAALLAHTSETAFMDTCAEALVALHLQRRGCRLRFEVPTPSGRTSDFEVLHGEQLFYLHIKRLREEGQRAQRVTISPRLRYLERIRRPYVVALRWREGLSDEQMQRFVSRAAQFISHARVGDELTVREEQGDPDGRELGGVRVVAPWAGSHVSLTIGLPSAFSDRAPRIRKLLHRAYQQFMPRAMNIILMCSLHHEDAEDYQNALLGSHIERWDAIPLPGQRIAHGRASDGFWYGGRYPESVIAGWFAFEPGSRDLHFRLWQRQGYVVDEEMLEVLDEAFGR